MTDARKFLYAAFESAGARCDTTDDTSRSLAHRGRHAGLRHTAEGVIFGGKCGGSFRPWEISG
ncbi:hypothetical protein [Nocardia fluminea]|uniref:hypothetical protein n=1 Tax=Nocardia fluminea TaxID=134984 RepID=UPI0034025C83